MGGRVCISAKKNASREWHMTKKNEAKKEWLGNITR